MKLPLVTPLVFTVPVCGLLFSFLLLQSQQSQAQSVSVSANDLSDCRVGVRLISGKRGSETEKSGEIRMQSFLSDMSDQLVVLPFSEFEGVDSAESLVAFNQERLFSLTDQKGNRHSIVVCPHQAVGGYVNTSVDWRGPRGESIVSTKMRIQNNQNVVLGADDTSKSATIVGVKINCSQR